MCHALKNFKFLWMNEELSCHHKAHLFNTYPVLKKLYVTIKEFREIFNERSMPYLYLFIDKFKDSDLRHLSTFAKGLDKDISAVGNAVASPLSNGFVEVTISKLKMRKRVMYGRASSKLLAAKMVYQPQ